MKIAAVVGRTETQASLHVEVCAYRICMSLIFLIAQIAKLMLASMRH